MISTVLRTRSWVWSGNGIEAQDPHRGQSNIMAPYLCVHSRSNFIIAYAVAYRFHNYKSTIEFFNISYNWPGQMERVEPMLLIKSLGTYNIDTKWAWLGCFTFAPFTVVHIFHTPNLNSANSRTIELCGFLREGFFLASTGIMGGCPT